MSNLKTAQSPGPPASASSASSSSSSSAPAAASSDNIVEGDFVLLAKREQSVDSRSGRAERTSPLTEDQWIGYFDEDGRIIEESELRKTVFHGGVSVDIRREVWMFLLGYFPFHSTFRERDIIKKERRVEYIALKARWKEALESSTHVSDDLSNGLDDCDPEMQFNLIQAKCRASRFEINEEAARDSIRTISKDVPRTDRRCHYYQGDDNIHLVWLNDILCTYAVFHPAVGYAQGMSDVLSLILCVMDDENDAYWCFSQYMETIQSDFLAHGMVEQLNGLKEVLRIMDHGLLEHLTKAECGDLVFCHRWLLLSFKREFSFDDALTLFEILCSHHLELSSNEANKAREQAMRKEREKAQGEGSQNTVAPKTAAYRFELFVCLAVLNRYRDALLACADMADVYLLVNSLVEKMPLTEILIAAENTFFDYCRKSIKGVDTQSYLLRQ